MKWTTLVLTLASAMPLTASGAESHRLRYIYRVNDTWIETVSLKIDVLDAAGNVISSRQHTRTDRVEVLSVSTLGVARLRRTDAGSSGPPLHLDADVSPQGECTLVAPDDSSRPLREEVQCMMTRRAPVLPAGNVTPGKGRTRDVSCRFRSGRIQGTETATLISVDNVNGSRVAELDLTRKSQGGAELLRVGALIPPRTDAAMVVPTRGEIRVTLQGATGQGRLVLDVSSGKLLAYRMVEKLGVDVAMGGRTSRRTLAIAFEVSRIDSLNGNN